MVTTGTSILLPHSTNCSVAPALKVSPATRITFLPAFFILFAILPILVVLPTPFTPTKRITVGPSSLYFILVFSTLLSTYIISISSTIISFSVSVSLIFSSLALFFNLSTNFITVFIPISAIIRISSSSSK